MSKAKPTEYKFVDWRKQKKPFLPTEEVNSNVPYVKWGKKTHYPLFLNTLYQKSPSQTGIINGKTFYITSGGYTITPKVPDPEKQKKVESKWGNGQSLTSVIRACAKDFEKSNIFCFTGRWAMGKLYSLSYMDYTNILTTPDRKRFFFSNDWGESSQSLEKTGFREIPRYDPANRMGEFIYWYAEPAQKTEKGTLNVYPAPPYAGCIESLMTEIEIQSFNFYETQNSFKSGTLVFLPSARAKSEEDRKLLADKVKEGAMDRETGGGVMILIGEGGTENPTVLQLNGNDLDKRYSTLRNDVAETILRGHSVPTPGLFGLREAGKLGDTQQLAIGYDIFKNNYVKGRQEPINEAFTHVITTGFDYACEFVLNEPKAPGEKQVDSEAQSASALNSMSPLVATKLLEFMTPNEIRALGKLAPIEGGDEISRPDVDISTPSEFSAKDPILKAFHKCGRKKKRFIIYKSVPVPHDLQSDWFDTSETELLESVRKEKNYFATLLSEFEKNVLTLINNGEDALSISKALDKSVGDVMNAYNTLSKKGLVKKDGNLSESGKKYLDSTEVPADKYEIRYSYELRPDAPKLIGESRPFCKELVALDKLYTREEIDRISTAMGMDVWAYRGGWYHNPDTKKNTPFCRHYWLQNVVIKK